jgi:phage terminase small subunit
MSVRGDEKLAPEDVAMISFFCDAYDIRKER